MTIKPLIAAVLAVAVLAGCASSRSGDVYSRNQTRHEMTVRLGVVESVREVTMEGSNTGVGTGAGAVIGGVAGSNVGRGKGAIVGTVLGAVIGGIAGNAIEDQGTKKQAMEITVKLESGQMIAVVQEGDPNTFRAGDQVRVLSGNGETRVTR